MVLLHYGILNPINQSFNSKTVHLPMLVTEMSLYVGVRLFQLNSQLLWMIKRETNYKFGILEIKKVQLPYLTEDIQKVLTRCNGAKLILI